MSIKTARNESLLRRRMVADNGSKLTCRALEQQLERAIGLTASSVPAVPPAQMKPTIERLFSRLHSAIGGQAGKGAATIKWNEAFIATLQRTATSCLVMDEVKNVGAVKRQLVVALGVDPSEGPQSGRPGKTHVLKAYAAQPGFANGGSPCKGAA